jgi:hypothetical protein
VPERVVNERSVVVRRKIVPELLTKGSLPESRQWLAGDFHPFLG